LSTAYIAVGSNLGDKRKNCALGIDALDQTREITVTARAGIYKTAPVDYTDQDWFVNTAVRIETDLAPDDLLTRLKQIERNAGRDKGGIRFGPRVLDLDIIFYDDLVLQTGTLDIPHPRMHKRRFVLRPICDIDPCAMHPTLESPVRALLEAISDPDQDIELLR
jgi:2-amino-4-hydroxy-6-hydroxymethyldihydropteridine diphosphokinase